MDSEKAYTILNKRYIDYLIEWKNQHEEEYTKCIDSIGRLNEGDFTMFEKLFSIALECIPTPVIKECQKIFGMHADEELSEEEAEFNEFIEKQCSFDGYLQVFTGEEGLDFDLVTEKDESDTSSVYFRIKGEKEWWQSIPMQYKMIAQLMLLGKTEKELMHQARRTIMVSCIYLGDVFNCLRNIAIERQDTVLLSALHYIAVEHGFRKIAKQLGGFMSSSGVSMFIPFLITSSISKMTEASLKGGYDKKLDWKKDFGKGENMEVRHAVYNAIDETQAKHGRHRVEQFDYDIDNYLIGDKELLKAEIQKFLNGMTSDNQIAYLWKALYDTGHLIDVSFPDFHRALQNFWGKEIKYDRAQRLYRNITVDKKEFEVSKSRAAVQGRHIINRLKTIFKQIPR